MSWEATRWAKLWRLGGANRKSVLQTVADYASTKRGPDGAPVPAGWAVCWASNDTVAADAEVSERTLRRLYAAFEEAGVIRRDRRHDRRGHRLPDAVWLPIGQLPRDVAAALNELLRRDDEKPAKATDDPSPTAHSGPLGEPADPVDNSPDSGGSGPAEPSPSGPEGPGPAAHAGVSPSGPQWAAQEQTGELVEEPQPPGLPTGPSPPRARPAVDNDDDGDDGWKYAAAVRELQQLPNNGADLIEKVRAAMPGNPRMTTLVITAGDLARDQRRQTA